MATQTYDLLYDVTVSTAATSVTLSNVLTTAAGYADLVAVVDMIDTSDGNSFTIFLNNVTSGFLYNAVMMGGNGSTTASTVRSNSNEPEFSYFCTTSSTVRSLYQINFFDFAATNKHKSALVRIDNASKGTEAWAYRFGSTAAVNTIRFTIGGLGKFAVGSTIKVYGIKAVA